MKTKLEMAHEYALQLSKNPSVTATHNDKDIASRAWDYADAMQAEADKRSKKHHDFVPAITEGIKNAELEEWQPDWSQAPSGYDWFVVGWRSGKGFFCLVEPALMKDHYWFVGEDCLSVGSHGYTGDWRNSLRKRPE